MSVYNSLHIILSRFYVVFIIFEQFETPEMLFY